MFGFISRIFRTSRTRHYVAIDIGSNATIRSLLFNVTEGKRIAVKKQEIELPRRTTDSDLIPLIRTHLHRTLFQYITEAGRVPDKVIIGLGSYFTFNEVLVAKKERVDPHEAIRPTDLKDLLNEFIAAHQKKRVGDTTYALAHLMPFRVNVDGYRVDEVARQTKGRVIEIALFATYAEEAYWRALEGLRPIVGGLSIEFVSNQAAVAAALVSILKIRDVLLVKVSSRITEVSLVGDGAILFTGQFEVGGDYFTKSIAKGLDVSVSDAERIKRQWDDVVLPARARQRANEAIITATETWLAEFIKLLKRDERFVLPERVWLFGGGARLGALRETLASRHWYGELTFLEQLHVELLSAERLSSLVFANGEPLLTGVEDVTLAALASRVVERVEHRSKN